MIPPAVGEPLRFVEAPLHNAVPLLLLTVGAGGVPPIAILIVLLFAEVPQLFTSYA